MTQFSRRVATTGVVALALALMTGSAGSAGALDGPPQPSYVKSWLALDTGTSNAVRLVTAHKRLSGTPQLLSAGKGCSFGHGGNGLLAMSASPDRPGVGFANGSIGVREKSTSSGTSCSAVDWAARESLTLKLGTEVGSLVAMSASLDIDLKQNARILATATLSSDPKTPPAYFELQSGTNIGQEPLMGGATIFTCNNPSDSGPDSGANNNCRWQISGPSWTKKTVLVNDVPTEVSSEDGVVFDTLTLEARAGAFSLMGGADGPVDDPDYPLPAYLGADDDPVTPDVSLSSASIFELVEGVLDCAEGKNKAILHPLGRVAKSTWTRLGNLTPGGSVTTGCAPYPYSATTGLDDEDRPYAQFNKPLDVEPNAQATWETTFLYSGNAIPPVYMDLDGDHRGEFQLEPCQASWYTNGAFVGPLSSVGVPNPSACLISVTKGKNVGSSKAAIYRVYVYGDARLRV